MMTNLSEYKFVPVAISLQGPVWGETQTHYIVGDLEKPDYVEKGDIKDYKKVVYEDGVFHVES